MRNSDCLYFPYVCEYSDYFVQKSISEVLVYFFIFCTIFSWNEMPMFKLWPGSHC